jgi:Zn-dependent M28 family amino/carboxypeptidase
MAFYNHTGPETSLPGAWIHTDLAERWLSPGLDTMGRSLRDVQQQLQSLTRQSFETDTVIHLKWDRSEERGTLHNVLGLLPGTDPSLAYDTIIVGAHRDHFGRQAGLVFPGADDNASGTAVLLETARVLAESGLHAKRSVLFISFSGEEQGLLGSRLYVSRPARPLANTRAMINIDHAGVGHGRLTIGVTGLEKSPAVRAGERAGLADNLDVFGFFPGGDHVPFKDAGVPTVTIVSSGAHSHFHQPSDTAETVQPDILELTAKYVVALVWELANQ